MEIRAALAELVAGRALAERDAEVVFESLLGGTLDEAQIGALLALMQGRPGGVAVAELVGAARAMRRHVTRVPIETGPGEVVVDTCGTGGTAKTFNISTAAAIVAAAARPDASVAGVSRVLVAKHGNRSRTGRGSAEVLAALGVNVDLDPAGQARCLREAGLCFCFAIHHHPAMRFAAGPRRSLGFATVFNVLGPLTNPAGAERQLIGVYAPELVDKVAAALAGLGARRAVVVHGDGGGGDGMDEASTLGTTYVAHVHAGRVERVERADLARSGVERGARDELTARDVGHSAEMVRWAIGLGNREGSRAAREIVVLNAGLALVAGEAARDVADGIARAREAIESGRAASVLERLVAVSRGR